MWKKRHLERFRNSVAETDLNSLQTISALNVTCHEVLVTDKVLRVKIERSNFKGLIKRKQQKVDFNGSLKTNRLKHKSPARKTNKTRRKFRRQLRSAFVIPTLNKRVPKENKKYLDFVVKPNGLFNKTKPAKTPVSPVKKNKNPNKPKLTINTNTKPVINNTITKLLDDSTDTMETHLSDSENDEPVYYLNVNLSRCGRPRKIKRNIEFSAIAKNLKDVKLPGDEWKIEIRLKSKVVNQIGFVNKKCNRSVNFYRVHNNTEIMFNDLKVSLIGAPRQLETIADLSILLDIIHHIDPEDPIVKCENDKFA